MHVQDQRASGTGGGTLTAGAWAARTLNTVVRNTVTGASLGSNQVTLPAGTYDIFGRAPGVRVNRHRIRLYDVTNATTLLRGVTSYSNSGNFYAQTDSILVGRVVLAATTTMQLEYRVETGQSYGGGLESTGWGEIEVYAELMIRQVL